jgi:hypothetical protein
LHDDEPEHVKAMVYYFYHLKYVIPNASPDDTSDNGELASLATLPKSEVIPAYSCDDIWPVYGYHPSVHVKKGKKSSSAAVPPPPEPSSQKFPRLVFHAKMYAMADKYNIKNLKLFAQERFSDALQTGWSHKEFPVAIRTAYETTLDTDQGLREPLVKVLLSRPALLDDAEVEAAVKDIPNLAYELLKRQHKGYLQNVYLGNGGY